MLAPQASLTTRMRGSEIAVGFFLLFFSLFLFLFLFIISLLSRDKFHPR